MFEDSELDAGPAWYHYKDLYELDLQKNSSLRYCYHLTERHIAPNNNQKMKVKFAAEVECIKFVFNVVQFFNLYVFILAF